MFSKQQQVKPEADKTNIKKNKPEEERTIENDQTRRLIWKGLAKNKGKREDEGKMSEEEEEKQEDKKKKNNKKKKEKLKG